jgi:hypothetical protein
MSVTPEQMTAGIAGAVDQGIRVGDGEDAVAEGELEAVKKTVKEYTTARDFDKMQRHRYGRDRRYAAGNSNPNWASDANIIGAFIDIISSFLYAKDPDVSARPAAHVSPPPPKAPVMPPMGAMPGMAPTGTPADPLAPPVDPMAAPVDPLAAPPVDPMAATADPLAAMGAPVMPPAAAANAQPLEQEDATRFAETAQIVISKSWKKAGLKRVMKRVLRSALSVGPGWFKSYVYSEQGRNPLVEKELSDARDNLERIEKLQDDLTGLEPETDQTLAAEELKLQIAGLEKRVELMVKRGQCIDFLRADDVQVSLDVPTLADYRDADWISHDLYIEKDTAKGRFKRIPDAAWGTAVEYVQRDTQKNVQPMDGYVSPEIAAPEGTYVRATDNVGQGSGVTGAKDSGVKFIKVVEFWDHRDMNIKTFVDGIDRWAVDPYPPEHAASRFYPFFQLALFEVDGARHPQSLVDRTWKLQDEYSSRRSSGRKTRERSIPGTVFLSGEMDPTEVQKLERSVEQEYVGIRTTTPGTDINKVMMPKPIPNIDPAIFATTDILYDMNVVTGVQEAQASGASNANTATEADIQQSGFASRTNADRDTEEDLLTEFAQYTLEIAVQGLTARDVQRLAGPYAFWPEGMDVEDILTLVEVEVEAGTTGKPRAQADKETWATLLPIMMELVPQIRLAEQSGDIGMAETLKNILRETLKRLDDRLTLESILAPGAAPPIVPGMPPGAPATSALPGAAPPVGNGTVNNPVAQGAPPI